MNILLATPLYPPEIGGPATYARLLKDSLPRLGHKVSILPFRRVSWLPAGIRHIAFFLLVLVKGIDKDVIFAQDVFSVGLPALFAAKILRKPFVVRVPGDFAWEQSRQRFGVKDGIEQFQNKKYGKKVEFYKRVERYIVNHADTVITPSSYFARLVGGWMKNEKPETIYNGINTDEIEKFYNPSKKKNFSIVSAGRLVPWKGFDALIKLVSNNPSWKLTIIGNGPEKEKLHNLAKDLQVGDKVKFIESLPQRELWEKINEHSVFVLNSSFESFSYQVVEAMALSMPVVATEGCNLEEIISDGKNGFLVPVNDNEKLEGVLRRIESDENLSKEIGKRAQMRAQDFGIEKTMARIVSIFGKLIEKS